MSAVRVWGYVAAVPKIIVVQLWDFLTHKVANQQRADQQDTAGALARSHPRKGRS